MASGRRPRQQAGSTVDRLSAFTGQASTLRGEVIEVSDAATAAPAHAAGAPELVMELGRALHAAGISAQAIEEGMEVASHRLGIAGQFFSTPTALFASFVERGEQRTILERVQPGAVNLERLAELDELLDGFAADALTPQQASAALHRMNEAEPRYGAALTTASFALASGGAAVFLGGGGNEVIAATLVGLLIGGLGSLAPRVPPIGRLFEPLAALLASLVATLAATVFAPLSVFHVTLAGLIVLVPGLTLTVAISELGSRQLVSGSSRLAGAVALFFAIALGVALGAQLGAAAAGGAPPTVTPDPVGSGWKWLALLTAGLSFTVLLRARPRDAGWVILAGVLAIESVTAGSRLLGPQLGAFAGALLVGVGANLFARLRGRPAALMQVPGLIMLVPGSLGFRSLAALLEQDVLSGVQTAFTTTLVAIALATGTLLASVLLPPRRVL